jgi:hypothetical protein
MGTQRGERPPPHAPSPRDGAAASVSFRRAAASFGSGQHLRERGLPSRARGPRHHLQYEPPGQLLRQRRDGELVQVQGRTNGAFVAEARAGNPSRRAGGGRTRVPEGLGGGSDPSEGRAVPGPWSGRGESRTSDGTHQRPSWGGEVAGARGSGLEGSRKCSRMAWAVEERRTTATTRRVPPQRGQARTSVWKVRLRSAAQGMGWRGRRDRTGSGARFGFSDLLELR